MRLLVVIVAFNSERSLAATLNAVAPQLSREDTLCILDNASRQPLGGLSNLVRTQARLEVIRSPRNLGFTGGNNSALEQGEWRKHETVLLLNPDLVLPEEWISKALALAEASRDVGIISGPLVKYDFVKGRPLGVIDSLGIERGGILRSWKDVAQGHPVSMLAALPPQWHPAAICGALMLISSAAINAVMMAGNLFDDRFFAYKEDIDLCLRMRVAGFGLLMDKSLLAFHGRGWHPRRREVSYELRKLSARNDVYLHYKHRSPYLPLSLLKALYVLLVERFLRRR